MTDLKFVYLNTDGSYYYTFKNELISGKDLLIQIILKTLLTKKGTNKFSPNIGSNFLNSTSGRTYSTISNDEVKMQISLAIEDIKTNVIKTQTSLMVNNVVLEDAETLVDLVISDIHFNDWTKTFEVSLKLITKIGETKFKV